MTSVRLELSELYAEYTADPEFGYLRERSNFVPGEGNPDKPDIMLVGEAPGRNEDRDGRPFVGRAGKVLDELLALAGIERSECWVTNVVKYRPVTKFGRNRTPDDLEIKYARRYLRREVSVVRPRVIVPLGGSALACIDPTGSHGLRRGEWHQIGDIMYFPTWHPAYVIYSGGLESKPGREMLEHFRRIKSGER